MGGHAIWGASEVLFCELDDRVLWGMQFRLLVEVFEKVLFCENVG